MPPSGPNRRPRLVRAAAALSVALVLVVTAGLPDRGRPPATPSAPSAPRAVATHDLAPPPTRRATSRTYPRLPRVVDLDISGRVAPVDLVGARRWAELDPEEQKQLDKLVKSFAKAQKRLLKIETQMWDAEARIDQLSAELALAQQDLPGLESAMLAAEVVMLADKAVLDGEKGDLKAAKVGIKNAKKALKFAKKLPEDTPEQQDAKAVAIAASEQLVLDALEARDDAKDDLKDAKVVYKTSRKSWLVSRKAWKKVAKLVSKRIKQIDKQQTRLAKLALKRIEVQDEMEDLDDQIEDLQDAGSGEPVGGEEGEGEEGEGEGDPPGEGEEGEGEGDPPGGGEGDPPGGGEGDPPGGGEGGEGETDPPPPDPDDPAPGGVPDPNPQSGPVDVSIVVQEAIPSGASGVDRADGCATFGVPFAEGIVYEVLDRPSLAVSGSDRFQFTTLSSWPDGSVRWALVSTLADVSAGGKNTALSIVEGGGVSGQNAIATEQSSRIVLNTGPMQVDLLTTGTFNLFDRVVVDGTQLVAPGTSPGIVGVTEDGFLMGPNPVTHFTIEQNGPMRAVVRADGKLRSLTGEDVLDYSCWITAEYGSRDVEVTFTVRNANISRPRHTVIDSLGLVVQLDTGTSDPTARFATHDGVETLELVGNEPAHLYQAYTTKTTLGVTGAGPAYIPHIDKGGDNKPVEKGYRLVHDDDVLHDLGDADVYPDPGFVELEGPDGGAIVSIRHMAQFWPAALEASGDGAIGAGLWTGRKDGDYTFVWRQHESRTAVFSFHDGDGDPAAVARRTDVPLSGRVASYGYYDVAGVFPYHLVTVAEQEAAYSAMGLPKSTYNKNIGLEVTRFLPAHGTGGANNHAGIEKNLAGYWLRYGRGGRYLTGLDLALYKSEWQILRSDGWHDDDDPGAENDDVPHSTAFEGDTEHRYREGIILAYHLTGDTRFRDAVFDEAEILTDIYMSPQERGLLQTMRAQALVAEFTGDDDVYDALRERVQFNNSQTIDVSTGEDGWGWEAAPDVGARRYYANSNSAKSEQGPGENYITRGFVSASFGPLAMFHASRVLGLGDDDGAMARGRLRDYAYYTREELLPWQPDPATRLLAYSYGVQTQNVNSWQNSNSHPILLGLGEAWLDTGDDRYLDKALEYIEQCYAQDHGEGSTDLDGIENRLDFQHFIRIYLYAIDSEQYE